MTRYCLVIFISIVFQNRLLFLSRSLSLRRCVLRASFFLLFHSWTSEQKKHERNVEHFAFRPRRACRPSKLSRAFFFCKLLAHKHVKRKQAELQEKYERFHANKPAILLILEASQKSRGFYELHVVEERLKKKNCDFNVKLLILAF